MLTTVGYLAAVTLALSQAGSLTLSEPRLTHGVLGPTRSDNKLLPGDSLFVSFDIDGIGTDADGKVLYSTVLEVTDGKKTYFKSPARDQVVINALGGNRVPAFARVDIGLDQPPGDYVLKVTVTDRSRGESKTLQQAFTVLPKGFGLVGLNVTSDADGQVPAGLTGSGETVYLNAAAVGFARATNGQPNLSFELRILDEDGKPTLAKPLVGVVNKDVPASSPSVPLQFVLSLNRPGKFKVELHAHDQVANKTFTLSFPVTILSFR